MQEIRERVVERIRSLQLPENFRDVLGNLYESSSNTFPIQESLHWDYKASFPRNTSDDYFGGILRLICAFHNTYGGAVVFGVHDKTRAPDHNDVPVDVERLNHVIGLKLTHRIECCHRDYVLESRSGKLSFVDVLLVPKRPAGVPPVRFSADVGKHKAGIIWGRFGHEVLEVKAKDLASFYMSREDYGLDPTRDHESFSIQHSIPPSPATAREFIGRSLLMDELWNWLIHRDAPRMFLSGPGGSGKSTLAHEFVKSVAESGRYIKNRRGDPINFAIYLSAKDVELNPFEGKQKAFAGNDFRNSRELYEKILIKSETCSQQETHNLTDKQLEDTLRSLFDDRRGLLVIDDIDTLTRKGKDSGIETLFEIVAMSKKGGKLLFTLRNIPAVALANSLPVPGVDFEKEYLEFVEKFCRQIKVAVPDPAFVAGQLAEISGRLPLIVEIIIALRRTCTSYADAALKYSLHNGEAARDYMFKREYEALSEDRPRLLLAALSQFGEATSIDTLRHVLNCTSDQVSEAIGEVAEIFLHHVDWDGSESRFEILSTAKDFVESRSIHLSRYSQLTARIIYVKSETLPQLPQLTLLQLSVQNFMNKEQYRAALELLRDVRLETLVLEHPKYKSILATVLSKQTPPLYTDAREAFVAAWDGGCFDAPYLRSWFYMELDSGFGPDQAISLCDRVVGAEAIRSKTKSEFFSKRGQAYRRKARNLGEHDVNNVLVSYRQAAASYSAAYGLAIKHALEPRKSWEWAQDVFAEYISKILRFDLDSEIVEFFKTQAANKHSCDPFSEPTLKFFESLVSIKRFDATRRHSSNLQKLLTLVDGRNGLNYAFEANKAGFRDELQRLKKMTEV